MTFKVIARRDSKNADETTWEPGCPLQLDALQVARNTETGAAFLQARFKNISGETVQSFRASFITRLSNGDSEAHEINPLDADIPSGRPAPTWDMPPIPLGRGDVENVDVCILSAKAKSTNWVSTHSPLPLPAPADWKPAPDACENGELDELKRIRADLMRSLTDNIVAADSEPKSVSDHDGWWTCPCGQSNVNAPTCCSCGAQRHELLELDDLATLKSEKTRRLKRDEAARIEAERREARKAEQRHFMKRGIVVAALIIAFLFALSVYSDFIQYENTWVIESFTSYDSSGEVEWKKEFDHDDRGSVTFEKSNRDYGKSLASTFVQSDEYGLPNTEDQEITVLEHDASGMPTKFNSETPSGSYQYEVSYHKKGKIKAIRIESPVEDFDAELIVDMEFDPEGYPLYIGSALEKNGDELYSNGISYEIIERRDGRVIEMLAENEEDEDDAYIVSYEYDENGNISTIRHDGKLQSKITYVQAKNPLAWTLATSNLKGRTSPL